MKWLVFLILVLAAARPAVAQMPAGAGVAETPIAIGTRHMLPSAVLGEPREVNVRLPASYAGAKPERRYPVLYILDGGAEQDFPHIAGLAQHGEMSGTFDEF